MVLYSVPLVDQLNEPTADHLPDENASANCVPAVLASLFTFLLGRPYDGDQLKDAVYGQGYRGATDPARYMAYAASQGIRMWQLSGTGAELVSQVQQLLGTPGPVLATGAIPSQWGLDYSGQDMAHFAGPTHQVGFCGDDNLELTAMNPWRPEDIFPGPSHYEVQLDSWWAERLVYGRIFGLEAMSHMATPQITPSWDAAGGTLTYPAHDGLGQIALEHAQAAYAHQSRVGVYPLLPASYDGAGNSVVLWSDCMKSVAEKAQNWAIALVPAAADLAAALTRPQGPVVDVAAIRADLQDALGKLG